MNEERLLHLVAVRAGEEGSICSSEPMLKFFVQEARMRLESGWVLLSALSSDRRIPKAKVSAQWRVADDNSAC